MFVTKPTIDIEYHYNPEWYDKDYFYSPDGIKEHPEHHCKRSFFESLPWHKQTKRNAIDIGARDGEFTRYLNHYYNHTYCFEPRNRDYFFYNTIESKTTHYRCAVDNENNRIDDLLLTDIDFIKIDTDGGEHDIIKGLENIIEKYNPVILLEVYFPDQKTALKMLYDIGYETKTTCFRDWDHTLVRKRK